jgi:hypothetical protein
MPIATILQSSFTQNRLENFAFLDQHDSNLSQFFGYQAKIRGANIYSLLHQFV